MRVMALALLSLWATSVVADGLAIDHQPVGCIVAEQYPRLTACFAPASQLAHGRVFFRAEGGLHWYFVEMQSDLPCFVGVLPKPKVTTRRIEYYVEGLDRAFAESRTGEYAPEVVTDAGACSKRILAGFLGRAKVLVSAPPGAPPIPAGFSSAGVSTASAASTDPTPSTPSTPPTSAPAATTSAPPSPAPPPSSSPENGAGGGGGKAALIVAGAGAAAAGVAILATGGSGGTSTSTTVAPVTTTPSATTTTTTTTTTTLPSPPPGINVTGRWTGTEDIRYPSGCLEHDNVTFDLTQTGDSVGGTVSFNVVTCGCCQGSSGSDPLSGSVDGTSITLRTPSGFTYNGTVSGNSMSGSISDPGGGASGDWGVKKR